MSEGRMRHVKRMPRGVATSILIGMSAAVIAWLCTGLFTLFTAPYTRLDQMSALLLGGSVGMAVLGARGHRQRRRIAFDAAAGLLLGGVGALVGASVLAFAHGPVGSRFFAVERIIAWLLSAIFAVVFLRQLDWNNRSRWLRESVLIAAFGGATAGAIFTLPGSAEAWQAVAFLWFGGAVAVAVIGPELWHAHAVVELMPLRDRQWNPVFTREWPLHDGGSVGLGEAQVGCVNGRIALYPPAGGVIADGHTVRQPRYLDASGMLAVGRTRYRLQVLRES